ncbi:hypothetical protein Lal_00037663 [Lupinus albus]|nr:hypothetical protein Lal_00037663 [Lupinus albus]
MVKQKKKREDGESWLSVLEYDLYEEKNPWEIWEEAFEGSRYDGRELYIFTTLKKKSLNGSRFLRIIGCGSWEAEDTGKKVAAEGTSLCIGLKKRFRFEKSGTQHDGGWILHEYSLDPSLQNNDSSANNHVLCRFRKNERHHQQKQDSKRTWEGMNTNTVIDTVTTKKRILVLALAANGVTVTTDISALSGKNIHERARNQEQKEVVETESHLMEQENHDWLDSFTLELLEGQQHLIQVEREKNLLIPNAFKSLMERMVFR